MPYRSEDSPARRLVAWLERPAPRSWALVVFFVAFGALVLYGFQMAARDANTQRAQQGVNGLKMLARSQQDVASRQQQVDAALTALVARVGTDEQATCTIQRSSLPPAHALVTVMVDINRVLTVPLSEGQRRERRLYAPNRQTLAAVATLERDLAAYAVLSSHVPASRTC